MTKEQFLSAFGDIDDKFIKEITGAPAILDKPWKNYIIDEEPQVVYLTNERIPFWKIAILAAAAVCVLTVGVFAMAKLHGLHERVPADTSLDVSVGSPEISNSFESGVYSEPNSEAAIGGFNFSFDDDDHTDNRKFSSGVRKKSSWYTPAEVNVYKGNLSSQNTVYISVYASNGLDFPGERITNTAAVDHLTADEPYFLTYNIDQIDDLNDKTLYLCAETDDGSVTLIGEWIP